MSCDFSWPPVLADLLAVGIGAIMLSTIAAFIYPLGWGYRIAICVMAAILILVSVEWPQVANSILCH